MDTPAILLAISTLITSVLAIMTFIWQYKQESAADRRLERLISIEQSLSEDSLAKGYVGESIDRISLTIMSGLIFDRGRWYTPTGLMLYFVGYIALFLTVGLFGPTILNETSGLRVIGIVVIVCFVFMVFGVALYAVGAKAKRKARSRWTPEKARIDEKWSALRNLDSENTDTITDTDTDTDTEDNDGPTEHPRPVGPSAR